MLINFVDLYDWKTKSQILNELHNHDIYKNEREWRKYVEQFNRNYYEGLHDEYIVHSVKGYKLTKNQDEILKSAADLRKRGINMLYKHSRTVKATDEKQNLKLELEELGIIE